MDGTARSPARGETETVSPLAFFLKYLQDPKTMGAVAPSGRGLAALMVSEIGPGSTPVLELGAGGGIFTEALLARGVAAEDIVAVELDQGFADRLVRKFPGIRVIHSSAEQALGIDGPLADERFGAVISGLPLLNLPIRSRLRLIRLVFRNLRADGALYQFTYGLKSPVSRTFLDSMGLREECVGRVFRNLPPATVYRIRDAQPVGRPADHRILSDTRPPVRPETWVG